MENIIIELRNQINQNEKNNNDLKVKLFELEQKINEKELNEKKYCEKDLYDFAMNVLNNEYFMRKRLDIIQTWAKDAVEKFKKMEKLDK